MAKAFSIAWVATSGEQVGRLLLQLGHKRAAFVSRNADHSWALERHAGLVRAMSSSGDSKAVSFVRLAGSHDSQGDHRPTEIQTMPKLTAMHRVPPLDRALAWPEDQINTLVRGFDQWAEGQPILERLCEQDEITAWVGDNDLTALLCLGSLGAHAIRVPQRISVVGFDDGTQAMVNNIASYNFNCRAVILAAMKYLLAPSRTVHRTAAEAECTEIQGYVVQRGSVGPAPASKTRQPGTAAPGNPRECGCRRDAVRSLPRSAWHA
jgi:DNA-binding LacI/PurR family transcriptional regulator